jgi:hypothetical protein
MDSERKKTDQATATFTAGELVLLNNALNEVCNGITLDDDEFQTRLGVDRKTARKLLAKLGILAGESHKK